MQNQILGFFIVTCVSLGVLSGVQWRELRGRKLEAAQLRRQVTDQTIQLDGQIAAIQTLQREQARLNQVASGLQTQIRSLQDTTNRLDHQLTTLLTLDWAGPAQTNDPLAQLFDAFLQHPSFQARFHSHQQTFLARLFGEGTNENIRALLGEQRFALYQAYLRTIGDRLFLEPYRTLLQQGPSPLRDDQFAQLLTLISDERQELPQVPLTPSPPDSTNAPPRTGPDPWNALLQRQEQLHRRVLDRSRDFLLPDQVQALARAQTDQIQFQKIALEMARQLVGSQTPERSPPAPPPQK